MPGPYATYVHGGDFAFAWGALSAGGARENYGQQGLGDRALPAFGDYTTPQPFVSISTQMGDPHSLHEFSGIQQIATTGETTMWRQFPVGGDLAYVAVGGANTQGEIGFHFPTTDSRLFYSLSFVLVNGTGGSSAPDPMLVPVDITAGGAQSSTKKGTLFGVLANGDVYAWGHNADGQFGDGTTTGSVVDPFFSYGPARKWDAVARGRRIVAAHAGGGHCLLLDEFGSAWSAGENTDGQLGRGTLGIADLNWGQIADPVGGPIYVGIAAGPRASLLVLSDGTVRGFGLGSRGQLGSTVTAMTGSHTEIPTPITGLADIVEAQQHGSCSWFRSSTGRLFVVGEVRRSSTVFTNTLWNQATNNSFNSTFGSAVELFLDYPAGAIGPPFTRTGSGVVCSKLGYVSGWSDCRDMPGEHPPSYSVIGSDGLLYSWSYENYLGFLGTLPGDLSWVDHRTIFYPTTTLSHLRWVTCCQTQQYVVAAGTITRFDFPLRVDGDARLYRSVGGIEPVDWAQTYFDDSAWVAPVLITPSVVPYPLLGDGFEPSDRFDGPNPFSGDPVWPIADEPGGDRVHALFRWRFDMPANSAYNVSPGRMLKEAFGNFTQWGVTWQVHWESADTGFFGVWFNGVRGPTNFLSNDGGAFLIPGATNLVATDFPHGPFNSGSVHPSAGGVVWAAWGLQAAYISSVYTPIPVTPGTGTGRGRSYAQIVGD